MNDTDRKLVDAHIQGDLSAFEAIIRRYGPAVLGYLIKMTHNRDTAEDLFQETFGKVHRKAASFYGEDLKPWLFAIAARTALSSFRKKGSRPVFSLSTGPVRME